MLVYKYKIHIVLTMCVFSFAHPGWSLKEIFKQKKIDKKDISAPTDPRTMDISKSPFKEQITLKYNQSKENHGVNKSTLLNAKNSLFSIKNPISGKTLTIPNPIKKLMRPTEKKSTIASPQESTIASPKEIKEAFNKLKKNYDTEIANIQKEKLYNSEEERTNKTFDVMTRAKKDYAQYKTYIDAYQDKEPYQEKYFGTSLKLQDASDYTNKVLDANSEIRTHNPNTFYSTDIQRTNHYINLKKNLWKEISNLKDFDFNN